MSCIFGCTTGSGRRDGKLVISSCGGSIVVEIGVLVVAIVVMAVTVVADEDKETVGCGVLFADFSPINQYVVIVPLP